MSAQFIPGLELSAAFSDDVVEPILAAEFPQLVFSTALMGFGSDVLGFDTPISMDHCWGPRLQVFVREVELQEMKPRIDEVLRLRLPQVFKGLSVNFSKPEGGGIFRMKVQEHGPVSHAIEVHSVPAFVMRYIGIDHWRPDLLDWLRFPEQALLELAGGQVFRDELPELREMRDAYRFFPRDIFLYRLAVEWNQIATDEAFLGRCGEVGDELGFRVITARLVRHLMRICFLLSETYAPYSKWFGSGFSRLQLQEDLKAGLLNSLCASSWQEAEKHLCVAYSRILSMHEERGLLEREKYQVSDYYGRPYKVVYGAEIAADLKTLIKDECLRNLRLFGAFDQAFDSIDATDFKNLQARYVEFIG